MVKKRGTNLPAQDFLDAEPVCKHLRKALDDGSVKRALVNVEWTMCQDCQADNKEKNNSEDESAEDPSVWLCLKCGHRGCGRNSVAQHALNHYNTPRSEPHCLVLNVDMWSAWCYLCDNEVPYNRSSRLGQLVDYLQRKAKAKSKKSNSVSNEEVKTETVTENEVKKIQDQDEKPDVQAKQEKANSTPKISTEPTVKGLSNLGNTCFFNAVMQNLSQTPALSELLNEVKTFRKPVTVLLPDSSSPKILEVNLEQQPGPLTLAMWQFLTEMHETKKGVVTPKELFSQVCKKAIRFKGYQQQDSQELLRYLLDGMRGEEIQRVTLAMSKSLQSTLDEEEIKKIVKDYEKRRTIPNFVDCLFGGELTSTIMCEECHTVSLVHEPFLDLSLPVLDDLIVKKNSKSTPPARERKEEEEEENDDDRYVKERDEVSPGASKHLQKKAKKAAKKQAKNQRRQQKWQGKTVLFTDLAKQECSEDEEEVSQNNTESETNARPDNETPTADDLNTMETDLSTLENGNEETADGLNTMETDLSTLENGNKEMAGGFKTMETDLSTLENGSETIKSAVEGITEHTDLDSSVHNNVGSVETNALVGTMENNNNNNIEVNKTPERTAGSGGDSMEAMAAVENGNADAVNVDDTEAVNGLSDSTSANMDHELTNSLNRLQLSSDLEPTQVEIEILPDKEQPHTQVYEVVNEDPKTAFSTLSNRKDLPIDEFSVLSCLYQFTHKETLTGNNKLLCNVCTRKQASRLNNSNKGEKKFVYTNAKKQMLVSDPSPILTLHLKRFQQNGFNLRKINRHIKFPEVLDLAPFCTAKCKNVPEGESRLLYSLYGVIEHSGSMRSGHYTAFVKLRHPNQQLCKMLFTGDIPEVSGSEPGQGSWYHISDSHVQAVSLSRVLSSQAYLLFYERML
ncbi:ubiquitin carboxyl-terminal hydrolase 16 isoform X2 [Xenopus laevis]|uniref:Ubiquitin carboxyl-terminal hydrolase 16 n=1 Tax=Xenopus laevis TaxID=8355 RepID=A0A8J0UEE2_XENLA|nr:ubiquitin carboxyl-terminal hydrolase 16 isoform X2 [Xenopus laevis]